MATRPFRYLQSMKVAVRVDNTEELIRLYGALGLKKPIAVVEKFPSYIAVYEQSVEDEPTIVSQLRHLPGFIQTTVEAIVSGEEIQERNWQSHVGEPENDLTQLQFRFAVFNTKDNHIYKLSGIDYRSNRFDCSGERMTKWIDFGSGVMFDFTNEDEMMKYYKLYIAAYPFRPTRIEDMLTWLKAKSSRISFIDDRQQNNNPQLPHKNKGK